MEVPNEKEIVRVGLTVFNVGERRLELREMKIKRTKELSELLFTLRSGLQKYFTDKDGNSLSDGETLAPEFFQSVNESIVVVLNFLLGLKGEETLTLEWYEDNISLRILEEIVKEAASQSRINWLIPFFDPFCRVLKDSVFLKATNPPS
ncbi:MAG: hypothetical protein KKH61_20105 [Gammaproteobacteria bacterium]|nr:hypothetical protein [Gammaproteobacteria bacterium]